MRCLCISSVFICFCGMFYTGYWLSEHMRILALRSISKSRASEFADIHQRRIGDDVANNRTNISGHSGEVFSNCSKSCPNCPTDPMPCKNCTTSAKDCKECIHPALETCYRKFVDRCSSAKHRVTKVLRMDTANAGYLLQQHKNLKLIQIFRDPRGTLNSRQLTGWYYVGQFTILEDAEILCNRIEKDIASAEHLMRLFPGRVKVLQYEDFKDSFKLGTNLYAFLNMGRTELTKSTKFLLLSSLQPGPRNKFHPDSFRHHLSWITVQSIDRTCHKVLERLGLRIFKNEAELRNDTLDFVPGSLPYALTG